MPNAEHGGGGSARGERAGASKGEKSGGNKGEKSGGSKGDKSGPEKGGAGRKDGSAGKEGKGGGGRAGGEHRGGGDRERGGDRSGGREKGSNKGGASREKEKSKSGGERTGKGRSGDSGRSNNRADRAGQSTGAAPRGDSRANRSPTQDRKNAAQTNRNQGAVKQSDSNKQVASKANRAAEYVKQHAGKQGSGLDQNKLAKDLGATRVAFGSSRKNPRDGSVEQTIATDDGAGHKTGYDITVRKDGTSRIVVTELDEIKGEARQKVVDGNNVRDTIQGFYEVDKSQKKGDSSRNRALRGPETTPRKDPTTRPSRPSESVSSTGRNQPAGLRDRPRDPKLPAEAKSGTPRPEREPRGGLVGDFKDRPEKKTSSPAFSQPPSHKNPPLRSDPTRVAPTRAVKPPRPERQLPPLAARRGADSQPATLAVDASDVGTDLMLKSALGLAVGAIGLLALPEALAAGTVLTVAEALLLTLDIIDISASLAGLMTGLALQVPGVEISKPQAQSLDAALSGGAGLAVGAPAAIVFGPDAFMTVAPFVSDIDDVLDMKNLKNVGASTELVRVTQGMQIMIKAGQNSKEKMIEDEETKGRQPLP
jgi:hypothetical protein